MEKDLQEEEVVIPFNWVDGKTVYWPQGTNPLNAMKCHQNPGKNWLKFPLIKLQKTNNNVKILNSQQLRKKEKIRMLIFSKKKKNINKENIQIIFQVGWLGSNIKDLDEVSMHLMSSSSPNLSRVNVIFSKSNMWKGAVWNEDLQEKVILSNWISDKTVC
ncbi:uncharacterized protein LOC105847467 [Hydra vulgaris]|uniref:uncharacterized protein LOC105847467 n=1 Tax=Hydra vulgaris TaxID=6087 RepID=UPI0032EA238D